MLSMYTRPIILALFLKVRAVWRRRHGSIGCNVTPGVLDIIIKTYSYCASNSGCSILVLVLKYTLTYIILCC